MPTAVRFSYTIRDAQGVEGSECYYGTATDAALATDLAAEWQTLAGLLDPITSGKIMHGSVSFPLNMVGGKAGPDADSRVEEVAIFNMSATGTTRRNGISVLAIADSKLTANRINLTDAAVAAFWAALAVTGGIVRFTNAYGQPLITLIDALLSFRKRRSQLQRVSFEPAL